MLAEHLAAGMKPLIAEKRDRIEGEWSGRLDEAAYSIANWEPPTDRPR
jgi:hypothetical protein